MINIQNQRKFNRAVDVLQTLGVSLTEIAAEMGLAPQTVRAMRLIRPRPEARRFPPPELVWKPALVSIATKKVAELKSLCEGMSPRVAVDTSPPTDVT